MSTTADAGPPPTPARPVRTPAPSSIGSRLWRRELPAFPDPRTRVTCLGIVVLTTVLFYYQYYVISGVSERVIADTGMSFTYFVNINVVSALASAVTSAFGGLTDRVGRANVVVVGILGCALTCLVGFPLAHGAAAVGVCYGLLGALEGIVLVATPALVRDFSPQLGRATAMGFWTIGPVAGSLVTSVVVSTTVDHLDDWRDQYVIAGVAGLVVFAAALAWLRELSPELRDQVVVSERDQTLAEARARGIDVEDALRRPLRQMVRPDVVGSALAISLLLIIYFTAVGFFPIFFQTVFGFSTSQANSLGNWMWSFQIAALIGIGLASDRLRVRKPFMLVGGVGVLVMTLVLINRTSQPGTSYSTWVVVLVLLAFFLGTAFAPWMAAFTETVERRNPALSATGLSLWGLIVRLVLTVVTFALPYVAGSVTTLVQDAPAVQALAAGRDPDLTAAQNATIKAVAADPSIATRVQVLAAKYPRQIATAAEVDPAALAALDRNPDDQAAQIEAVAQIADVSPSVVTRVAALEARYRDEIRTADAIDPATQLALLGNPTDPATLRKAGAQVAAALRIPAGEARSRLAALAKVPTADLLLLSTSGRKVSDAGDALTALAAVPAADLAFLDRYGTPLSNDRVVAELRYLQDRGPAVQQAALDAPREWQHYFWIAVAGQLAFLPLLFLMAGRWSPRRARREAQEHEARVEDELARIAAGTGR